MTSVTQALQPVCTPGHLSRGGGFRHSLNREKTCPQCKDPFVSLNPTQIYCSPDCYRAAKAARHKRKMKTPPRILGYRCVVRNPTDGEPQHTPVGEQFKKPEQALFATVEQCRNWAAKVIEPGSQVEIYEQTETLKETIS